MDPAPFNCLDNQNDEPPPLEDMSDVLRKMHFNSDKTVSSSSALQGEPIQDTVESFEIPKKDFRRTEDRTSLVTLEQVEPMLITSRPCTSKSPTIEPSVPSKPLKRGFFDAKPKQAQPKSQPKSRSQKVEEIPLIRPSKSQKDQQNKIPEFMRLEHDPSRIKLRQEVREMMKPTQELVKDVMETTDIKNGLEDPEIMAAVAEIAGNPDAMHKYTNDKKVVEFYNQLGKLMRSRIQQDKAAQHQNASKKDSTNGFKIHPLFLRWPRLAHQFLCGLVFDLNLDPYTVQYWQIRRLP